MWRWGEGDEGEGDEGEGDEGEIVRKLGKDGVWVVQEL